MSKYELGEVIAKRELQLRSADGIDSPVTVSVGRPRPNGDDWQCPYEIDFRGAKRTFAMHGVDSVQALVLTLRTLDFELEVAAKQAGGTLLWLDKPFRSLQDPVGRTGNL